MSPSHSNARSSADEVLPSPLIVEREGGIACLTLSRPQRHNAIDGSLAGALGEAIEGLVRECEAETRLESGAGSEALRAVVLRGAGPSFCSGADLEMLGSLDARGARRFMQEMTWSLRQLEALPVPSLAVVHGYCVGGGLEIALHCDLILAAEDARFGLPEIRHGLVTTAGAYGRLVESVGKRRAAAWLLSGELVEAVQAEVAGLLAECVPGAELEACRRRWEARLCAHPPGGVGAAKALLGRTGGPDTWLEELGRFEALVRARDSQGRQPRGEQKGEGQ